MERVMIIGCCGAGKSTLSESLSRVTELETIHLDQFYWKPNWEESTKLEWVKIVEHLSNRPKWIIDGNYEGTIDIRINKADTIIFLDYSTLKCLWRITKRIVKYHGRERPDMAKGCKERFDFKFYHFVGTYNMTRKKNLVKKLDNLKQEKQVFIFRNDKEIDSFFKRLNTNA